MVKEVGESSYPQNDPFSKTNQQAYRFLSGLIGFLKSIEFSLWPNGLFGCDGSVPLAHTNDRFLPF